MTILSHYVYRGEDDLQHYITPDRADAQLTRLVEWMGDDLMAKAHVYTPGTIAHMQRFQRVRDYVIDKARLSGKTCDCELIPELIGLEGETVWGNVMGDGYRFFVARTPGLWLPQHTAIQCVPIHALMWGRVLHRGDVTDIRADGAL